MMIDYEMYRKVIDECLELYNEIKELKLKHLQESYDLQYQKEILRKTLEVISTCSSDSTLDGIKLLAIEAIKSSDKPLNLFKSRT